jgi:RNA polymerase sigma-70 factor (ECF subfamily)
VNSPETDERRRPDDELIMTCLRGDRHAFRLLMQAHQRYAYALAFRLLHDDDRAKDAVQEAFIQVWKKLSTYRPEIKFNTWLYKIVVHRCYDRMKMEARKRSAFGFLAGLITPDDIAAEHDVHRELEQSDMRQHILEAAKKLPPRERLVFHLRDLQDFTIAETAEYAGISAAAVKTNLHYARKRIRLELLRVLGNQG